MPITLPVPGGGGATPPVTYYNNLMQLGEYQFVSLTEVINNFMAAYVGQGKILQNTVKGDVSYHAHRGLQELHYDTLRSCKSIEIEICPNLKLALPHDYVNYIKITWVDSRGIERIIYPTKFTSNPHSLERKPCKEDGVTGGDGSSYGDSCGNPPNSSTWVNFSGGSSPLDGSSLVNGATDSEALWKDSHGERFGLEPQHSQTNGSFYIDCVNGVIHFSSNMVGKNVILHYISDGLGTDDEMQVHKFAEEAMYRYILCEIMSLRRGVPEYAIRRYKKDKRAAIRQAKLRLSNIKLEEITQIFRGKSKWIKH